MLLGRAGCELHTATYSVRSGETGVSGYAGYTQVFSCSATGTSNASCIVVFSDTTRPVGIPYTGVMTMIASASYGSVSALAEVSAIQDIGSFAEASASFTDTLTVLGSSGDGYIS